MKKARTQEQQAAGEETETETETERQIERKGVSQTRIEHREGRRSKDQSSHGAQQVYLSLAAVNWPLRRGARILMH